jgi:Tol biopolymer transport system component
MQIAFIREYPTQGEGALIIANVDGTGERKLILHKSPEFYSVDGPSWSPDGKHIAAALGNTSGGIHFQIVVAQVVSGAEQAIGSQRWEWAMRVAWLSDGSGLVIVGRRRGEGSNNQLWRLAYPNGAARRITNDLNDYRGLSLMADNKSLVTVQSETRSNIWVVSPIEGNRAVKITSDSAGQNGRNGLDWSPDGRIVYTSLTNGLEGLWIMNADGSRRRSLTSNPSDNDNFPAVSGDGRYIVFASSRAGPSRIWRIDIDGGTPKELTKGDLDLRPSCSPDGQWVAYSSEFGRGVIRKIYRVSINGGASLPLTDKLTDFSVVSPDGKLVACVYQEEVNAPRRVALIPSGGGAPIQYLDIPVFPWPSVRWSPDGRSLAYLNPRDGSSNIWLQPLAGGASTKLTDFESERIFTYAWSRDGRYLACARGAINRDVVLISDIGNQ